MPRLPSESCVNTEISLYNGFMKETKTNSSSIVTNSVVTDQYGVRHYTNGVLHNEDGPAAIYTCGTKYYYTHGKFNRKDGPAVFEASGMVAYYTHGVLNRTDGPAVTWPDGSYVYFVDGKKHRVDGPAVSNADGSKEYYIHGVLHNEDGPAVITDAGNKYYYIHGVQVSEEDFPSRVNPGIPRYDKTTTDEACKASSDGSSSVEAVIKAVSNLSKFEKYKLVTSMITDALLDAHAVADPPGAR